MPTAIDKGQPRIGQIMRKSMPDPGGDNAILSAPDQERGLVDRRVTCDQLWKISRNHLFGSLNEGVASAKFVEW